MDTLDDENGMSRVLQEIGSHHFFYNAYESHFELMHEGFMEAMRVLLDKSNEQLDSTLCRVWDQFWGIIKTNVALGINNERRKYLLQALTPIEMEDVGSMWEKIRKFGLDACGRTLTTTALEVVLI